MTSPVQGEILGSEEESHWEVYAQGREKAVANTPHFSIIFTVFYFLTKSMYGSALDFPYS